MSALAIPRPVHRPTTPARRHLEVVGPGFVPQQRVAAPAAPLPRAAAAARPAVRLTARGRMVRAAALLVLALGAAIGAGGLLGVAVSDAHTYAGPVERVSVGAGDTVWAIAAASAGQGQDVRQRVEEILQLNGLASGDLVVGQQLVVPAG